ncbi:glycosyltransferase [Brevibacillus massiliensis]|uniref:glycosyltransferase n=1 Tax=Brevibacillus massiliensis TaxID=1118054 RepID=UPI0002F4A658|nr:glycosyltransferase [Brevibacillus massiliensis]
MNIAIDMSFVKAPSYQGGIGRYSRSLLRNITLQGTDHSFSFFYPEPSDSPVQLREQLQRFLSQNQIELFHIQSPFEITSSALLMRKEWFGKTRVAVTIYDFIPFLFPHVYLSHPFFQNFHQTVLHFVKSADVIFAISETTKRDAVRLFRIDSGKIHVILAGLDDSFKWRPDPNRSELLIRYGITKPYILSSGGADFRKNIPRLIEGFARANKALHSAYQLVLSCNVSTGDRQKLRSAAEQAGVAGDVVIAGHVPEADLVRLYNGASLFAFPSLYEGFGLPILEAMACGVPVLASDNSSLAEIFANAAYLVNPESIDEIAAGIHAMLTDPALRNAYREKGLLHSNKFQWKEVASKVLNIYRLVARKRIAIFSPVPPIQSGVADLQERILPDLAQYYDCDIFIDDGYTPSLSISPGSVQVYNHRSFPELASRYNAIIYQMGNHTYHQYMVPYLRSHSGIVIMHEANVHGMSIMSTLGRQDVQTYYQVLSENFGSRAQEILTGVLSGSIPNPHERFMINKYYVAGARHVVVHNQYTYDIFVKEGVPNVTISRLPVSLQAHSSQRQDSRFVFASFGFLGPQKHIDKVIRCLKKLVDSGCSNVYYHVIGLCEPGYLSQLVSLVQTLQLESRVTFFGYVPNEERHRHISGTDVAVNIRYPTCGESSASLLDTLSHGIPTIVSDIGSFREFPDEVVKKIPAGPDDEQALFESMLLLYRDRNLRTRMSQCAKEYIDRHHSINHYVQHLRRLIEGG